ncbi:hypothetical protein M5K25_014853 [Dendrobium thyrsiflorum]|uniref:Uncharacterized protein n=1 Tax=Dendrobium thyrsiflorum TaxID=117978 RepID=A0ABD0UPB0_DENTH
MKGGELLQLLILLKNLDIYFCYFGIGSRFVLQRQFEDPSRIVKTAMIEMIKAANSLVKVAHQPDGGASQTKRKRIY